VRRLLVVGLLLGGQTLLSVALDASVTFVNPQAGAQAVGPQWIEITTNTANIDRVEFYVDGVLAGVARTAPYRIAYDFGVSGAARIVAAKVLSNGYRDSESATVNTAALTAGETMNVDLVEVPLRVKSSRTVRAEDLRIRENDVEQTIRDIKPGRGAAHFAFVVDRSLSMGGGRLDAALQAIDASLSLLRDGDTASLVLFNQNVSRPRELTKNAGAMSDVVPSGGTSLRDAVASVPNDRRTYTIVITDGGDRNSQLTDEQALRKISGTKSIVSAIVFGTSAKFLQRAASNTGGTIVSATKQNVAAQLRNVITDINSRYLVVYQSHGTKSGWRTINVTPKSRSIEVTASRKGYFAG
jgi:hypothetical protein